MYRFTHKYINIYIYIFSYFTYFNFNGSLHFYYFFSPSAATTAMAAKWNERKGNPSWGVRKQERERWGEMGKEREEEAFISGSCVCVRGHATVWHNHTHMHTHTHCATLADIIRNHSCGGRIMEQGARSRKKGARRKGANILWAGQLACWRKYCHLLRHWSYCLSVWRCSNSLSHSHTHTQTHSFIYMHTYICTYIHRSP